VRLMKLLRDFVKEEEGSFIVFQWSYLFLIFLILILILLPDLSKMSTVRSGTQEAAAFAIKRVAEQGQMTDEIASEVENILRSKGITNYEIYGTGDLKGFKEKVEVKIVSKMKPIILRILPNIRLSNSIAIEDGVVHFTATKVDVSDVYIRN